MTSLHTIRRFVAALVLTLVAVGPVWGEQVQVVIGALPQQYPDFATAVAACNGKRMLIAVPTPVHASVSVPISCELEFVAQGQLVIDDGVVVTINGTIVAPLTTLFVPSGTTGQVAFATSANQDLYIQWWGATCNGIANDAPALNAMYAAMSTASQKLRLCAPSLLDSAATPVKFYVKAANLYAPFGTIKVTGPIVFQEQSACGVHGIERGFQTNGSVFDWTGSADPTIAPGMFLFESAQCALEHINIHVITPHFLLAGLVLAKVHTTLGPSALTPRNAHVRSVNIIGNTNELNIGVRMVGAICLGGTKANVACTDATPDPCASGSGVPGGTGGICTIDSDNDDNVIENTNILNFSGAGVSVEMSQSFGNRLYDVEIRANAGYAPYGMVTGGGACTVAADPTQLGHICDTALDCDVVGSSSCPTCVCSRQPASGGGISWLYGFVGNTQEGVVSNIGQSVSNQTIAVRNLEAEGNVRLLYSGGPTGATQNYLFEGIRFAVDTSNQTNCTGNRKALQDGVTVRRPCCTANGVGGPCMWTVFHHEGGTAVILNSMIGEGPPGAYELVQNAAGGTPGNIVMIGSTFQSTIANIFHNTNFPFDEYTSIGNIQINNGVITHLPNKLGSAGITFTGDILANLGTPADGTQRYCTNCAINIVSPYTCATGGQGAIAKRINGAWLCE